MMTTETDHLDALLDGDERLLSIIRPLVERITSDRRQLALLGAVADEVAEYLGRKDRPNPCDCDLNHHCWDHRLERAMVLLG